MDTKRDNTNNKLSELLRTFQAFDSHYSGCLERKNLLPALQHLGCKVNEDEINAAIKAAELSEKTNEITLPDFKRIYQELCKHDPRLTTIENVSTKSHLFQYGSSSNCVADDTLHSVSEDEQIAFSSWMERNLKEDRDCAGYFPFQEDGGDLYAKCSDGILLCKIINCSSPGTIDQRAMNIGKQLTTFQMHENITLALNSARAIGCNVVNIGAGDILTGTKHLLLGLLWQIIKIGLLKQINVVAHAELATLLEGDETISDFAKLSPEDILIRWVNYHLQGTESDTRMHNFTMDVRNCEVYAYLVEKIAPQEKKQFMHSTRAILDAVDLVQRAEMVLQNAEMLNCRVFVRPQDIVSGSQRLNLAFLANLFHGYPALEKPPDVEEKVAQVEETREEKTYRNWINSMGITPNVNYLYSDLTDGIVLLKLFDAIKRDTVDWNYVHSQLCPTQAKANFQRLENCNHVITLGRRAGFSLVGVAGADLCEGKRLMTLALLWQLMRAYTLSILARLAEVQTNKSGRGRKSASNPIAEDEIIAWANTKLKEARKSSRICTDQGFSDPNLATGLVIIDLIDAVRPGSVDYNAVLPGKSKQDQLINAQYAIPLARRIGASVYAVPEDIVELKAKMIMTIFACLMIVDLEGKRKHEDCSKTGGSPKADIANTGKNAARAQPQTPSANYKAELEKPNYLCISGKKHMAKRNGFVDDPAECEQLESVTVTVPIIKDLPPPPPAAEKLYKKTLNLTLSSDGRCLSPTRSTLYTKSAGPAGDCISKRDQSPVQPFRSRAIRGYTEPSNYQDMRSSPRYLSPVRYDIHAGERSTNRERSKSAGRYESSNVSKSTPSVHLLDSNLKENQEKQKIKRHHTTYRNQEIKDIDQILPPVHSQDCKENVNHLGNQVSWRKYTHRQEEKISSWKQEGHSYRSHGGGRLFLATQSKK